MPFVDLARTDCFRHLGLLELGSMGTIAMRAVGVEYHAPARYDDIRR